MLQSFYEKIIYKIAKAAKVEILNVSTHKFEPQGFTLSSSYYLKATSVFIPFLKKV